MVVKVVPKASKKNKTGKGPSPKPKAGEKPVQSRYKRIYDLGPERKALLDSMFLEGKSVAAIIEVLHAEFNEFKDVQPGTLTKYLYRYKWDVIDKGLVIRQAKIDGDTRLKVLEQVSKEINVMEEIAQLVTVQRARVNKLLKREEDMPMLFNSLGNELKTLSQFVQQFADLSFDLGTMKRVPNVTKITKDGDVTTVESDGFSHLQLSVEQSKEVEEAARNFFEVLEHGGVVHVDQELLAQVGVAQNESQP